MSIAWSFAGGWIIGATTDSAGRQIKAAVKIMPGDSDVFAIGVEAQELLVEVAERFKVGVDER
jgi:hypothetical protein